MTSAPVVLTGIFCQLCREFISNLFAFDFSVQDTYPSQWLPKESKKNPDATWGDAFRHHETFSDLEASAKICELCNVLYIDLAPMDPSFCQGWLGLYPFWFGGRSGGNKLKGHFRAGFSDSLTKMPWGGHTIGSVPLHSFKVCRRGSLKNGEDVPYANAYRRVSAIPVTLQLSHISHMATIWQRECSEVHKDCAKYTIDSELPTRVIDLGDTKEAPIRLYESKGEKAAYTALSHCWGGPIPSILTTANKTARTRAMDSDALPQNFKDAIQVTRALQIRYLWIDALCIIQDSKDDWFREAGKMRFVYAGATVVISALDAPASTTGFLNPNRIPSATLNDEYAVQKVFPEMNYYLEKCPLVSRGWCMQERFLANPILHFGKEQMFWECRSDFMCEDGSKYVGDSSGHVMALFLNIRKRIGVSAAKGAKLQWKDWYQLLQEYTTRNFTVSTDKLPAMAGAAALFKSTTTAESPGTYVAGLWKEDIARGLLWCAHYYHAPGRRVWGISQTDEISLLAAPPEKRAPSWSWAALDGQLDFWALRTSQFVVEVVNVSMSVGENEFTEACPIGTVTLRGLFARMFYHPPPDSPGLDVGNLTFGEADSINDKTVTLSGCVMDLDRRSSRFCSVILIAQANKSWYFLVLDKNRDGSYRRVGMCTAHSVEVDSAKFETLEVAIA